MNVASVDDAMYQMTVAAEDASRALHRFLATWRAGSVINQLRPGAPCCGTSNAHCGLTPREVQDTPTGCEACGHPVMCHWY